MKKQKALDIIDKMIGRVSIAKFPEEYKTLSGLLEKFRTECQPTLPDYKETVHSTNEDSNIYAEHTFSQKTNPVWEICAVDNNSIDIKLYGDYDKKNYTEVMILSSLFTYCSISYYSVVEGQQVETILLNVKKNDGSVVKIG